MSASLVGSEMCIRDSPASSHRGQLIVEETHVLAQGGDRASALPLGVGPVSYTHLTLPTICSV
eukprot:9145745-Alexandrium_andersonii.AAC.1